MPVQPFILFYDSVVKVLQQPPLNWVAGAGYELAKKHKNIINDHWQNDSTPPICAKNINDIQMNLSQKCTPINFTNPIICKRRIKI